MRKKIHLTAEAKYGLLKEISYKIRDTMDLDVILNQLLDSLKTIIEHDAAGIFILSQDLSFPGLKFPKQLIAGIARHGYDEKPVETDEMLTSGKGIIGYVIRTGENVIIPDVRLDSRYIIGRTQTLSEIAVPIMRGNRTIGALDIESDEPDAFNSEDLDILSFFADAASISIEKAMLHHQILARKNVEIQLQIAGEVQSGLLPVKPPEIAGYDVAGISIPNFEIGGDYFDYIPLDNESIAFTVADVSGDGIPAALVMTAFRALLRSQARNFKEPADLMKLINEQLSEFIRKRDFITAFYGILNIEKNILSYSNCGHNPPLLFHYDGNIEKLQKGGPSLSIIDNAVFEQGKISLSPGDEIVLYTDGVIEIFCDDNSEFGVDGLINVMKNSFELTSLDMIKRIEASTKEFSKSEFYNDDFTLVVIKRNLF